MAAPTAAPDDTPIMYGSAIGFLKTPCIAVPETARAAPTRTAKNILGNLIFRTMALWMEESDLPNKMSKNI
jgi:hypothetical protein